MKNSQKYQDLSYEDLEKLSWHILKVENIFKLCNPFFCWNELKSIITFEEISECLNKNEEELVETPLFLFEEQSKDLSLLRKNHIKKIAYFVKNGFNDPISIDVGIPDFGYENDYYIEDGNHRLAAAIIRKDKVINCIVNGSENYAKQLNLWNPNDYQKELDLRDDQD